MARRLQGRVRPPEGDAGGQPVRVLVTRGGERVAEVSVGADGGFDLEIPEGRGLVVTVIGQDRRVLRRSLGSALEDAVDLGELEIPVAEYPPGIAGQAWDVPRDRPVTGGRAILRLDGADVDADRLDADGRFSFELSEQNPLVAGTYRVIVEVPGYGSAERAVEVTDDVTSYRIGRVELTPAEDD